MQETLIQQNIFSMNYPTLNVRVFQRDLSIAYEKKYYYNTHFTKQSYLTPFFPEKIRDKWKEWRAKRSALRNKIEDKILLNLLENTEKDVTRFMKQKKISIDQADILFTMLGELKSLIK